jgi:hypothetical protein
MFVLLQPVSEQWNREDRKVLFFENIEKGKKNEHRDQAAMLCREVNLRHTSGE